MKGINGSILSQGRGTGSGMWITPNSTATIKGCIVTPMAQGDIHLENLSLEVVLQTSYGTYLGEFTGSTFKAATDITHRYLTVPPIEIYHSSLAKGGLAVFNPLFINQGTADLTVETGDVSISIYDGNGSKLCQGTYNQAQVNVLHGCSQSFPIEIMIPSDAPDSVKVEAVINANCTGIDGDADSANFNVSTYALTTPPEYNLSLIHI